MPIKSSLFQLIVPLNHLLSCWLSWFFLEGYEKRYFRGFWEIWHGRSFVQRLHFPWLIPSLLFWFHTCHFPSPTQNFFSVFQSLFWTSNSLNLFLNCWLSFWTQFHWTGQAYRMFVFLMRISSKVHFRTFEECNIHLVFSFQARWFCF